MKTIIIDAGGVLVSNLSPRLWQELARLSEGNMKEEALYSEYKQQVSPLLWTGQYTEEQFWLWLEQYGIHLSKEQRQSLMTSCLQPLSAYHHIAEWSKHANLILMSNHLTGWIEPAIKDIKGYFTSCYISSEVKLKKPALEWFQQIEAAHPTQEVKLFIDDSLSNLEAARQAGWDTLLADSDEQWINELEQWLYHC